MAETVPSFDPEPFINATAPLLGLEIDAAWIASVAANLRVLATAADLLSAFPLPDTIEAAPRFEA